ncbi:sugar ABC transporter ATP-binding protein [Streptomyces sp. NPDC056716]|uniref:sugar ABC transporter ATP-binding protein n=1 Tax=unclassified Streptomyces TaxID=2593676 RepID=UPI0036BF2C64
MATALENVLSLRGIRKSYGGNEVLKGVDLAFRAGEVHALLGPNGAGKSTLLGCLSGATRPDSGTITLRSRDYPGFTPTSAFEAGTSIIYQHFQLIGELSIADNIFLGSEQTTGRGIDNRTQNERTARILGSVGADLDPTRLVETLSVGEQQIVEIARALRHEPSVLILDEPTAALSDHEVKALLNLVRRLAHENGLAVVFVTHILREVLQVADVVTILRNGELLWTKQRSEVSMDTLVDGISPLVGAAAGRDRGNSGIPLVTLNAYSSIGTGPVDLTIHEGEVVGIFGLLGSGRTDLLETIAGVRGGSSGTLSINGRTIAAASPAQAMRAGIALVPSDRKTQALFGEMTSQENLLVPHYATLSRPFRSTRAEREIFTRTADGVNLLPRTPATEGGQLSGGNAQKVMVGRWVSGVRDISFLLLDEPTQGVDIGARGELYGLLHEFIASGPKAVLFATSDPDEIVALADRVVVIAEGKVVAVRSADITENELLRLAHSGSRPGSE